MQVSDRIGRRLKLQDLHVLMAVVEAGSMNKAATLLNTGQSAISRSIADLEQTVGVRLVERSARGVEPTQYGRALLDGGTAAFDDLRRAMKTIEFLADPTAGEVRIGSSALLAGSFVSALVDRLSQRYPGIVFHLVTGHNRRNRILRDADEFLGDRALSHSFPSLRIALFRKPLGNQNLARQSADGTAAKRNRNAEEPRARPRRSALH